MKTVILVAVLIILVAFYQTANAHSKSIFLVLETKDIKPAEGALWKFAENSKPVFPEDLAVGKFIGCAVISFVVSDSGRTKKTEVVNTVPAGRAARSVRKVMRKVRWQPVVEGSSPGEEQRLMRLDFCMSGDSNEAAEELCEDLAKMACE